MPNHHSERMLVQWLLPVRSNQGDRFPQALFNRVRQELTTRFGGVTAYPHSPATGLWEDDGDVQRDELVLFEVMVQDFDAAWWAGYRECLCDWFHQEEILMRAIHCQLI